MATNNIKVESIDFDNDSNLKASFQIDGETFHIEISGDEVKKIVPDMPAQSVSPATTESSGEESSVEESPKIPTPGDSTVASDSESPLAEAVAKVGTTPPSNVSDNSKTADRQKTPPVDKKNLSADEFTKKYPIVELVLKGLLPFLKSNAEIYKEEYGIKEGKINDTIKQLLGESYDELTKRSEELENSMSGGNRPAAGAGPSTIEEAELNLKNAKERLANIEKEDIPDEELKEANQFVKLYENELNNVQHEDDNIEPNAATETTDVEVPAATETADNEEPAAIVVNPDAKLLKDILENLKANKSSILGMRTAHEKMGAKIYNLVYFVIQTLALDTYDKFITKYDKETEKFKNVYLDLQKKIQKMESIPKFNPSSNKYITLKNQEQDAQDKYYRFLKDFKEHLNNSIEKPKFGDVQAEEDFEESVNVIEQMRNYIESEFNKLDNIRISHTASTKARLAASTSRAAEKTKSVGKSVLSAPGKGLRGIGRFMGYGGKTHKKRSGRGSRTTRKNKYLG